MRVLIGYLRSQWPRALLFAVLLLGYVGLQLVNPQILRRFIDVAVVVARSEQASATLLRTALLFVGMALAQQVIAVLVTYVGGTVSWGATNALRADLADHCLRLDMSFHGAKTPGQMIERVDGDVTALQNFLAQFVVHMLGSALLLFGVLIMLFREDWRAGLAFTGFVLVVLLVMCRLGGVAVPHWIAVRQARAEQLGFLEERLSGTEDISSCGAKDYVMRRFYQLARELMKRTLKAGLMTNLQINLTSMSFTLSSALALALGAYLFRQGTITIGTVYVIFYYSGMLTQPMERITHQMQGIQQAGAAVARVQELFCMCSKIRDGRQQSVDANGSSRPVLPVGALAVAFQSVSFGYDMIQHTHGLVGGEGWEFGSGGGRGSGQEGRCHAKHWQAKEMVLRDLSFQLQPGTVLGLLGRTGSGKTTLTRLLFRLYEPDSGEIQLGNDLKPLTDIRQVPLVYLRKRVGLVTQDVQLFHAAVRDNLTFFDRSISDEQILEAFRELGLWRWYQSLQQGLDTKLESGGKELSAGEAQLLAFARIFLRNPGLVVLDEASSRLDPITEGLIECAVDRLTQNRTAIIVAHRLKTVQRADAIMILEDGRISEYGARSALASDPNSRFRRLLRVGLEEVLA